MKRILIAAAIAGTLAAIVILYLQNQTELTEDPTLDSWD